MGKTNFKGDRHFIAYGPTIYSQIGVPMRKVMVTESCAGVDFGYFTGQVVEETLANADFLDSMVRGGNGYYIGSEKKKIPESPGPNEDTNLLHDVPAGTRGSKLPGKTRGRGLL